MVSISLYISQVLMLFIPLLDNLVLIPNVELSLNV